MRDGDRDLLMPSLVGICLFFFLGAPIVQRLFGVSTLTPELVNRYADSAAELVARGIGATPEAEKEAP